MAILLSRVYHLVAASARNQARNFLAGGPIQAGYSDAAAKRHLDDKAERIAVRDITRIRAGSSLQKPQLRGCVHNRQA